MAGVLAIIETVSELEVSEDNEAIDFNLISRYEVTLYLTFMPEVLSSYQSWDGVYQPQDNHAPPPIPT